MLDPDRDRPARYSCYPSNEAAAQACNNADNHPLWRHALSWDEVEEYLDQGAFANDRDGDKVEAFLGRRTDGDGDVRLEGGGRYTYQYYEVLIENVQIIEPTTPEEEDEAIASILNSFK